MGQSRKLPREHLSIDLLRSVADASHAAACIHFVLAERRPVAPRFEVLRLQVEPESVPRRVSSAIAPRHVPTT